MVKVNTVVVMSSKMMVEGELLCVWLEFNLWTYGGVCSTNYRPLNIGQVVFHDWKVHWGSWQVRFYRILFYPKNQVFCMHYSIKSLALLMQSLTSKKRNQTGFTSKSQPWRNLKKNVKGLIFFNFPWNEKVLPDYAHHYKNNLLSRTQWTVLCLKCCCS